MSMPTGLEAEDEAGVSVPTGADITELVAYLEVPVVVVLLNGFDNESPAAIAAGQSEVETTARSIVTHPFGRTPLKTTKTTPSVPMQYRAKLLAKAEFAHFNLLSVAVKVREIELLVELRANGAKGTPVLVER